MIDLTQIIDQITKHFGGEHLPDVFKKLTANEELLAAIWRQYEAVMSEGEIDVVTKELLGMCVGVAKPNEYIIGLQQRRIRRAGVDETAEMEVLSVAGFFEGFNSYAHVLHFDTDLRPAKPEAGDVASNAGTAAANSPCVESDDPVVNEIFAEIKTKMDISFVPNIFVALAHQPAMLRAKWESYQAIMMHGQLTRQTKELIAMVVSAVNGCFYSVDAYSTAGRQLGLSPKGLVEVACVIDLFANLSTLAKGFRLGKRNY
jgi:AhpD family alkylhydroperoxidase